MSKLWTGVFWVLVTLAAIAAGEYIGRRFLRGHKHIDKILTISSVLVAALGLLLIGAFHISVVYILWVPLFIGALGHGASR
jgi:hypothetical protein